MSKQSPISVYYVIAFAKLYSGRIAIVTESVNGEDVFVTAYARLCGKFYVNDVSGHFVTKVSLKQNQRIRVYNDISCAKKYLKQLDVVYTDAEVKHNVCNTLHNYVLSVTFKDIVQNKTYSVCLQKVDMQKKYIIYRAYDGIANKVGNRVMLMPLDYFRNNVNILFTSMVAWPNWYRYKSRIAE